MRHGKRFNHLGRTTSHRKAMLSNMASSLFVNKRINTTLAKAKELRKYVEPLITKAKSDTTHSRRVVFSYLQNKESVQALFNEVADRVADRPGGYTRIIKLGNRLGDAAEMAMVELVDFNDLLIKESAPKKTKTRRRKKGSTKATSEDAVKADDKKAVAASEEVKDSKPEASKDEKEKDTEAETDKKVEVKAEVEAEVVEEKEEVKEDLKAESAPEETDVDKKGEDVDKDSSEEGKDKKE